MHFRAPKSLRLALPALAAVACDNPLALPPAQFANTLDTAVVYALRGTALALPSGFDIVNAGPARTDRSEAFDFAFDIADDGAAIIYPANALGVTTDAALLVSDQTFESVLTAPTDGFQRDTAVTVVVGTVLIGRSRVSNVGCALVGALPRYGKFRVLAVDLGTRALTLETLINTNCGYRDLEPGLPEN
jgi:hypothetical protein